MPGAEHRVVLLPGPNHFLATEYTNQIKEACASAHGEVDVIHFEGSATTPADVLDECRSLGLLARHKVVVVDGADALVREANRPLVERYVQSPEPGATLVLRARKWYKGKLDDMIAKVGIVRPCEEVGEAQASAWATRRATKRHRATLEPGAADLLVERCGPDLGRLDSEIAKLASAGTPGPDGQTPITLDLVRSMVGVSREEEAWDLQGAVLAGGPAGAIERLRHLTEVSRAPDVMLWWAVMDLTRKLHAAAWGLKQGQDRRQLAFSLKIFGPSQEAVLRAAAALGPTRAAEAISLAVESDARYKSGLGDAGRTLEVVTLRLATMLGSR